MKRGKPPQRKTPLARSLVAIKRSPIRRKPKRVDDELAAAAAIVRRRSGGWCEAKVGGVCTRYARQAHHVRLRSRGGADTPDNLLDVCDRCHSWIHANPEQATRRGLMRSAW